MDGKYGDSTRSVKAVGSEAIPGSAGGAAAGSGVDVSPVARRDRTAGQLRPQLQSDLAPTGIGAGRTRRRRDGIDVRFRHGSDHVGAACPRQTGHQARGARRRLLPGAPVCDGIPCAARGYGCRGQVRRHLRCRLRRRRGAGRNPRQPRPGRRRSAPSGDDLPWPRRHADRRQHHRDTAWPAAAVAWCRPGGGQRDQGAVGAQRSRRRLRRRQPARTDGRRSNATGCWPGRSSARSRRGWCCAASAAQACGSNGSARTLRRSP